MDDAIAWLMEGDPAIRWQTQRDLLDACLPPLQCQCLLDSSGAGCSDNLAQYQDCVIACTQ